MYHPNKKKQGNNDNEQRGKTYSGGIQAIKCEKTRNRFQLAHAFLMKLWKRVLNVQLVRKELEALNSYGNTSSLAGKHTFQAWFQHQPLVFLFRILYVLLVLIIAPKRAKNTSSAYMATISFYLLNSDVSSLSHFFFLQCMTLFPFPPISFRHAVLQTYV